MYVGISRHWFNMILAEDPWEHPIMVPGRMPYPHSCDDSSRMTFQDKGDVVTRIEQSEVKDETHFCGAGIERSPALLHTFTKEEFFNYYVQGLRIAFRNLIC